MIARSLRGAAVLLALAGCLAGPARAQDDEDEPGANGITLRLDHGIRLDLPPGWIVDGADDEDPGDATGRLRARVTCVSAACRRTQETCTFILRREPVEGSDDGTRTAGLYASPIDRYARLRAVLKSTGPGSGIRQALEPASLGGRSWYVVETNAAGTKKSGLFAETVIGGRYLGAICRTCERGEDRYGAARAFLATIRQEK